MRRPLADPRRRFMAACLAACVIAVGAQAAGPDMLRIGNGPEAETLDPHRVEGVSAGNIVRDLYEGLTSVSADGRVVPGAAEAWHRSEDGLVYTFTLRENLRWSNGDALTAEDFAAGLRRSLDPATGSAFAQMLAPIRGASEVIAGTAPPETLGVRALDAHTLEIELAQPATHLPGMLTHASAYPVHRPSLAQHGRQFARPGRLVGNGAYRLADWVLQSHVELERNPHYWNAPRVAIERVRYVTTEDVGAEYKRYRAGELDITYEIPPVLAGRIRAERGAELRLAPYAGVYYYGLNLTRPPFEGAPELRAALSMAIDREALADKVLGGVALPAYGWVPPATAGHAPQQPEWAQWPHARRIEEARRLYARAGYDDDRPLDVEIRYNTHDSHRRVAIAVAAMWKQTLGVRTRLVNEEFKVFLHNRRLRERTQVFRAAWMADYDDASSFLDILHSTHGKNDSGWQNPQYDALLAAAGRSADPSERAELLQLAERVVLEDWPVIPIYFYVSKHLVSPRVRNWTDNVLDYHYSKDLRLVR